MRVAVCQFAPSKDVASNQETITSLARAAAADGARVAVFPEAAMYQCMSTADELQQAAQSLDGSFVASLTSVATEIGLVLVVGMYETRQDGRPYNTVVAIGPQGILARHRKYIVYDAFGHRESDTVEVAKPAADLFLLDGFNIGLLTCYEIRFPECTRSLVDAGADIIVMSAAWPSGKAKEDHFDTMVRSRALENTVYVAAAGDCSPAMIGRSHVVDPLGYQIGGLGDEAGYVCVEVSAKRIAHARVVLPVLEQRRQHFLPTIKTI